jgi:hypothetical protein
MIWVTDVKTLSDYRLWVRFSTTNQGVVVSNPAGRASYFNVRTGDIGNGPYLRHR